MPLRERLSPDALARAVQARIALRSGVLSPGTAFHPPIARQGLSADGCNWHLDLEAVPEALRPELALAAVDVAATFNLN